MDPDRSGDIALPFKRPAIAMGSALCVVFAVAGSALAGDCGAVPATSIDWSSCNKVNLMLYDSTLDGANLSKADLSYTDLRNSSLAGANFEKAAMIRSSIEGSKAPKAIFDRIEGYRTNFSGVTAPGASFASAEVQRADFSKSDLTGANFAKAELGRAVFTETVITGVNFTYANLARAQLASARFEGPINFQNAFMFLTRLEGLDLSQATGLQQWQVDQACGSDKTKLPSGLKPAANWPCPPDPDD